MLYFTWNHYGTMEEPMTITLKNIPPRLHRELKRRAAINRRSLNSEVLACLEKSAFAHMVDPERRARTEALLKEIRESRERMGGYLTAEQVDKFKKEGRE
jgi:plasmid stability protein